MHPTFAGVHVFSDLGYGRPASAVLVGAGGEDAEQAIHRRTYRRVEGGGARDDGEVRAGHCLFRSR